MKLLVDECLSPELATFAQESGLEAYHVAHRGWSGQSDARILEHMLEEELVLITNNRDDFLALIGHAELHPGLIILVDNVRRSEQLMLLAIALHIASALPSMINRVIEVRADGTAETYDLPVLD